MPPAGDAGVRYDGEGFDVVKRLVAAGAGVAVVPRSVLRAVPGGRRVTITPFRGAQATTRTMLVWREGHRSPALDAMRKMVRVSRGAR